MECHICDVRSSVGYCVKCHGLLCETCGVPCDQCGKISCGTHTEHTKSGKVLCAVCFEERRAKKESAKAEFAHRQAHADAADTSFTGLQHTPEAPQEISAEALVESASRRIQPWQLSLYIGIAGIALGFALLLMPSLRHIAFGKTTLSTGYLLFVFVALAGLWAWIGLRNDEFYKDRVKCFYGVGAGALCAALACLLIATAPEVTVRPPSAGVSTRSGTESKEELKNWRENALRKYQPGAPASR